MKQADNVILFPQAIQTLEREGFAALDAEDFKTALEKFEHLLSNQVSSFTINFGVIMCLLKLDRHTDAVYFCAELVENKDDKHFYDYFMQYILLLFEQEKHNEITVAIGDAIKSNSIPKAYLTAYKEMYLASYESNETEAIRLLNELKLAIKENDDVKQWQLIDKWKQLGVQPPESLFTLLSMKKIHPLVKTNIVQALQSLDVDEEIEIVKFEKSMIIRPTELEKMDEQPSYQTLLEKLQQIEQENPTLFQIVKELLDNFHQISFPFFLPKEDINIAASVLVHLGKQHLSLESKIESNEKIIDYLKYIQTCNEMYFEITQQ